MAMAIQNLAWGIAQPFAGGLADRYGTARVLVGRRADLRRRPCAAWSSLRQRGILFLTAGVLTGVGIATSCFSIVMAAFGRNVPPEKRSFVFGVATAASSFGQFVFAPIGQGFISRLSAGRSRWSISPPSLIAGHPADLCPARPAEQPAGQADLPFMQALSRPGAMAATGCW